MAQMLLRRLPLLTSLQSIRCSSFHAENGIRSAAPLPTVKSNDSFGELGIVRSISDNLRKSLKITEPTPVQKKAIPRLLDGYDVMIQSETGSGKTLAFILPLLQKSRHMCATIIMVPTRELACQILASINALFPAHDSGEFAVALVSGTNNVVNAKDIRALTPRVIVSTPKRLVELMTESPDLFAATKHVVLDEVDRLLPPGHGMKKTRFGRSYHPRPALLAVTMLKEQILKQRQGKVQLVAVSATLSQFMRAELLELGFSETSRLVYMQDRIGVPAAVRHQYAVYTDPYHSKAALLTQIFNSLGTKQALVFMDSRAPIDSFVRLLKKNGVLAEALHHHLADPVYLEAYKKFYRDFESGKIAMAISTESTVRGLDFPFIKHVILLETPRDPTDYIHVAGRASRVGQNGTLTTLVCSGNNSYRRLAYIYKTLELQGVKVAPEPLGAELQFEAADETWDTSDCVILDGSGSEAHHEKREAERKRVDAGLEAEKPRKKSKVPDSGPLAFGLEEEVRSPEEERALLESEFAMPVISDLPYDVAELSGPKEFERDDD